MPYPKLALHLPCMALLPTLLALNVVGQDSNSIVIEPLPEGVPPLGSSLGPLAIGTLHWAIEGKRERDYLGAIWAGPADFDADGRSEWALAAPVLKEGAMVEGRVWLLSFDRNHLRVSWSWSPPASSERLYAGEALAVGDFDGDGFADLAVGSPAKDSPGSVLVFAGGSGLLTHRPSIIIPGDVSGARFGASLAAKDINQDGLWDLVIGAPGRNRTPGRVFLHYGTKAGLAVRATGVWTGGTQPGVSFGSTVQLLDSNGDNQIDLVATAPVHSVQGQRRLGRVMLFLGDNGTFHASEDWSSVGIQKGEGAGMAISAAGDMDKDGFDDLVVGFPGYQPEPGLAAVGEVRLYRGGAKGFEKQASWHVSGTIQEAWFGCSLTAGGDVNGDGWPDLIVGTYSLPTASNPGLSGKAEVFLGGSQGFSPTPSWSMSANAAEANTGKHVAALGDVNRDGFHDFAVGSPLFNSGSPKWAREGRVDIFFGHSTAYLAGHRFPCDSGAVRPHDKDRAEWLSTRPRPPDPMAPKSAVPVGIAAMIGASSVIVCILAIRHQRRRSIESATGDELISAERERIAQDLHDGLGSSVHGIQRLTEALTAVPGESAEAERLRRSILETAQSLGESMDRVIWAVNPANDSLEGTLSFLGRYALGVLGSQGINVHLDLPATIPNIRWSGEQRQHVFLAVNELMNNILRHAQARNVVLSARLLPSRLLIAVDDDGCGAGSSPRLGGGNGLQNIRSRMSSLGGLLVIQTRPRGGTRAEISIPLSA